MENQSPAKANLYKGSSQTFAPEVYGKADIGEFLGGVFVMPSPSAPTQARPLSKSYTGLPIPVAPGVIKMNKNRKDKDNKNHMRPQHSFDATLHSPKARPRRRGLSFSSADLDVSPASYSHAHPHPHDEHISSRDGYTSAGQDTRSRRHHKVEEILCYDKDNTTINQYGLSNRPSAPSDTHSPLVTVSTATPSHLLSLSPSSTSFLPGNSLMTSSAPPSAAPALLTPSALKKTSVSPSSARTPPPVLARSHSYPDGLDDHTAIQNGGKCTDSAAEVSGRWAGMSNAPHPSDLPLPLFTAPSDADRAISFGLFVPAPTTAWQTLLAASSVQQPPGPHSRANAPLYPAKAPVPPPPPPTHASAHVHYPHAHPLHLPPQNVSHGRYAPFHHPPYAHAPSPLPTPHIITTPPPSPSAHLWLNHHNNHDNHNNQNNQNNYDNHIISTIPSQPGTPDLSRLSTDLRKMLNISK